MNNDDFTSFEQWIQKKVPGTDILYKIGDVTRICDVTRKALLVYEEAGIISPIIKNETSGFRYYTPEDIRRINALKMLQKLGLSLKEINEYFNDSSKIDLYIERFETLRDQLDNTITELKQRKRNNENPSEYQIEYSIQPKQVFYSESVESENIVEIAEAFKHTFIRAINTNKINFKNNDKPSIASLLLKKNRTGFTILNLVSMNDDYNGPNRYVLEETSAVGLTFRGPYEKLLIPMKKLDSYIKENDITVSGPLRFIWLEGPTVLGNQPERFLTKILYPIKKRC